MAGTKELRRRIRSVKNTAQITKAMQMVASSKMHKAQLKALAGRTYSTKLSEVLHELSGRVHEKGHPLLERRPVHRATVIVISPDKGLCGPLNSTIYRMLSTDEMVTALMRDVAVSFITIGKKARQFLVKTGQSLALDYEGMVEPDLPFALPISRTIMKEYTEKRTDLVLAVYAHFESTLNQKVRAIPILPIERFLLPGGDIETGQLTTPARSQTEYTLEPDPDSILDAILPHYIESLLYQILLEAAACEHSARMVAMKNATDNALELVDDLTLTYNQIRQNTITREIVDIATAGAALA